MTTPFFMRLHKTIELADRVKREAKIRADSMKAQMDVDPPGKKKKSIFGQAIKMAADFTPDIIEDAGKVAGREAWQGLQTWGSQVQSVPAALFTEGTIEDGRYTTKRNLIGNPLSNVVSHIEAQRKLGIAPKGGNLLQDINAGFKSARMAGKAYEEDPDIAAGTKFGTSVAFDPTSFLAAGAISKIPKIAAIGGAKGKAVRGAAGVLEGFESPAQVGKFAIGGALGTEAAARYDVPGVNETVEQLAGGLAGGGLGASLKANNLKSVDTGLAKIQGREGKRAALGMSTDVLEEGERVYHGTPTHIPKGEIMISPKGDIGAGFYLSRDYEIANSTVEGDTANVTGFSDDFIEERRQKVNEEGGQQVMRFKPKRDLLLLRWADYLTEDEAARINNVLKKRGLEKVASTSQTPPVLAWQLRQRSPNILGILDEAGFDGFSQDIGGYPQITVWKPNEVLEETVEPPMVLKGSAAKRDALGQPAPILKAKSKSTVGEPIKEVTVYQNQYGLWEFESPDGWTSLDFDNYNDAAAQAKAHGYKPVMKSDVTKLQGPIPDESIHVNNLAEMIKEKGYYPAANNQPYSGGFNNHSKSELANLEKALEWADSKGLLNEDGKKQFSDVLKKMDEISPTKGAQSLLDQGFVKSPEHSILYKYDPATETLQAEGKTFVATKLNGEWVTHLDDGTKVTGISIGNLVDEIDMWDGFSAPLSPLGKALKDALKSTGDSTSLKQEWLDSGVDVPFQKWLMDSGYSNAAALELSDAAGTTHPAQLMKQPDSGSTIHAYSPVQDAYFEYDNSSGSLKIKNKDFYVTIDPNGEFFTNVEGYGYTGTTIGKLVDELVKDGHDVGQPNIGAAMKPKEDINKILSKLNNEPDGPTWIGASGIKPVTPEEIMGLDKPTGPKSVDEFIQFTEEQLGPQNKYGDAKDYAPPGQEGAPVAGAPKGKGSATPYKNPITKTWELHDSNNHILMENEDLGDLIDNATKSGFKVLPPEGFGGISGGALPETLITPITPEIGLTKGEKIGNAITKIKTFVLDHGVKNNAIATPIAKEYLRINNVMKTHATNLGKLAQRVEKLADIRHPEDIIDMEAIGTEAKSAVEALKRAEEAFYETQLQLGVKKPLDPSDFWASIKDEEHAQGKRYSDMLHEYGNAVANKVSDSWMKQQIDRLSETIEVSAEAGRPIPTSSVSNISDVKLPKELGDVLRDAVAKVHPQRDREFTQLFNAINNQLRGMWAAGDASFIAIQQLLTWADNPKIAAKSVITGFETIKDPTVIADFIKRHDEARYGTGKPTVTEYIAHNMHLAQATGQGTDIGGIGGKVQSIKGYGTFLKKSNTLFTETGNVNRIMIADYLWDQYQAGGIAMLTGIPLKGGAKVGAKEGMTRGQILDAIAEAANRSTGYSTKGFGGPYGSAIFFAPRFMQSQIEMIMKASWGNQLENQVARRQLAKLIAIGTGLTVAVNEFNGESTEFDPRSSNFMRMKNVAGSDISVFGPWDTLVKGIIRSSPQPVDGDWTDWKMGQPEYLLRSKLSPVLSTTVDWLTGENVIGDPSRNWENVLKNTFLPFSLREVGQEPLSATGVALVGGKATPLTSSEKLDNKLEAVGVKKSDPDYLIKRREYLTANPGDIPKSSTEEFKRSREIQENIKARRKANDDLALSSGQTLVEFRENRKKLLTEQRNRLDEVIKSDTKKLGSKQQNWLNSYFKLFDEEENKNFITGEVDPEAFDAAVAKWVNTEGNGAEALNFVNRYTGTGLNTVESAYFNDMRKLEQAGYFDKPKYQRMKSDLTEREISDLVRLVDSARVANPNLQSQPWATTAKKLLKGSIDSAELLDVIHSRLDAYQNPEVVALKKQFGKETLWFNPRADWSAYSTYSPGTKSSGGKLTIPKIGGSLKANLKPSLK